MVSGRDVLLEVLRTEGVRHVFGNPGSTELPLIDALAGVDDLALRARPPGGDRRRRWPTATRRPPAARRSSTSTPPPGSATPSATSPTRRRTARPLVVTAGQQDYAPHRHRPAALGRPRRAGRRRCRSGPTRSASLDELGTVLRRAFHDAAAPPGGPGVRVAADGPARRTTATSTSRRRRTIDAPRRRRRPRRAGRPPHRPARVAWRSSSATRWPRRARSTRPSPSPRRSARRCTARRCTATAVFPPLHPLWHGMLAPAAAAIANALAAYDRVLPRRRAGVHGVPVHARARPCRPTVELLHLSPDPHQLGRAWPVRLGLAGDPRATLAALLPLVQRAARRRRRRRADRGRARREARGRRRSRSTARSRYDTAPMDPMAAAHALVRALPGRHRRGRRGHHHRRLRARLPPRARRPAATSSARAAGSAGACRPRSACRSATTERRSCASSATARPCTRRRRCGRRPTSGCRSCSPSSTTAST